MKRKEENADIYLDNVVDKGNIPQRFRAGVHRNHKKVFKGHPRGSFSRQVVLVTFQSLNILQVSYWDHSKGAETH